jgi:hypothetical protein
LASKENAQAFAFGPAIAILPHVVGAGGGAMDANDLKTLQSLGRISFVGAKLE